MIEPAARIILSQDAVVGPLVVDRIYFGVAKQNERRPRLVLLLVSSVPGHTFEGKAGYRKGRLQCDCLAPTYAEAKALASAAQSALDNFSGTRDDTIIDWLEVGEARDIPMLPPTGAENPTTFGVAFDVRFMHQE